MVLIPFVMNQLEKKGTLKRVPWANAPIQIGLLGLILTFATPMCCAIFQHQASIKPTAVEPELQNKIKKIANPPEILFYKRGYNCPPPPHVMPFTSVLVKGLFEDN